MKKIYILFLLFTAAVTSNAQNWSYVGAAQFTGGFQALNLPDMETNSSGEFFVGYETGTGGTKPFYFAKYSSGSWSQLPSPGTYDNVNKLDIEVNGSDYYFSYARVRGSNMYVFVTKFNGSGWAQVGDSILLGNSGSGGNYDFVLDNNGVPTVVGAVAVILNGDKQMVQYTGGAWNVVCTIPGSAATVFADNSTAFNSQNKLYCITQGFQLSPFKYFAVVNKIDGGTRTTVGDTLFNGLVVNTKMRVDATDVPFVCFYGVVTQKVYAYKLNGSSWNVFGDTTFTPGTMYSNDITSNGNKMVFYSLGFVPTIGHHMFIYENNSVLKMDSINAVVGGVSDVVIPAGTNDVYILILEVGAGALSNLSVMKHDITGGPVGIENVNMLNESLNIFPNPAGSNFNITLAKGSALRIYNVTGQLVYNKEYSQAGNITIEGLNIPGIYYIQLTDKAGAVKNGKVIIQ